VGEVAGLPGDGADRTRTEQIESLRRRMSAVSSGVGTSASDPVRIPAERLLPVPGPLAALLPHGGLVRGTVVSLSGATSLLSGLLASVTATGGHAAVVGHRRLGLLAAAEMGARLPRLAVIADPGPDPIEVAAVLLDGMDMVVLDLEGIVVPPSRARVVAARVRNKGAVLVVTGGRWDGAHVGLEARVDGYRGLTGAGRERLCGTRLSVRAHGRAFAPRTVHVDVCVERDSVTWVPDTRPHNGVPDLEVVR